MFEIVFSFNVKDTNIYPCLHNIRLLTYRNASVLCQSESTCLHITQNMVVFFVYPKGRALMQLYRVVPIPKRVNQHHCTYALTSFE